LSPAMAEAEMRQAERRRENADVIEVVLLRDFSWLTHS
jgi:hypothetical protein